MLPCGGIQPYYQVVHRVFGQFFWIRGVYQSACFVGLGSWFPPSGNTLTIFACAVSCTKRSLFCPFAQHSFAGLHPHDVFRSAGVVLAVV